MFSDKNLSLLFRQANVLTLHTQLLDALCNVLFLLGVVGNVLGLFIFSSSRRSWRISSMYAHLATLSSITNLLCLIRYASILHSYSRQILSDWIGRVWWACKIYELSFSFRLISSWITLLWMFERVMCVSKKLQTLVKQWNAYKLTYIILIPLIVIIFAGVIGLPVYMFGAQTLKDEHADSMNNESMIFYCGVNRNASIGWQKYFSDIHFGANHSTIRCLFSELIPTGAILLFNSYILFCLFQTCRRLERVNSTRLRQRQSQTTSWMNTILVLHSSLFLCSLFSHILGHVMRIEAHETWWVSTAILINCSLNFYIYCLSGKAFRKEIRRLVQRLLKKFHCSRNGRKYYYYHHEKNNNRIYE